MPDKPRLQERIRDDTISHAAWHFTGDKILQWAEERWRGAIGSLILGAMASFWGYLKGLTRPQLIMVGMAVFAAIFFVWDMLTARRGSVSTRIAQPAAKSPVEELGEIRFDHPGSPLDRWDFASDNPQSNALPAFSAPLDRVGGLTMAAPSSHHIDLRLEPHYKVSDRIKFEMKLTKDSRESYVYA